MKYYRRTKRGMTIADRLEGLFSTWKQDEEVWLFVGPHDDDIVLGAGLLLQAGLKEKVKIYNLIVTDGRMGYCKLEQRDIITEVRKKETMESFKILGVPEENVFFGDMPDCDLNSYVGRRRAKPGDPAIEKHTGLQNLLTYYLRKVAPKRIFLPTGADLHPDHKIVYQETLISLFHASGNIWPELGPVLKEAPFAYEFEVYCDFPEPPEIKIVADEDIFKKKLEGILAYRSQEQIAQLVDTRREGGPYEFFKPVSYSFYHPSNYVMLF